MSSQLLAVTHPRDSGGGSGGGRDSFQVSANANAAFGRMDHRGYSGSGGNVGRKAWEM